MQVEEQKKTVVVAYLLPIPHADRDRGEIMVYFSKYQALAAYYFQDNSSCQNGGDIKAFLLYVEYSSGSILDASAKVNSDENKHHSCDFF